jgi:hypothetical protein
MKQHATTTSRTTGTTAPRRGPRRVAAAMVGLSAVAALLAGTPSQATASTAGTCVPSTPTLAYKPAVTAATDALTKTLTNLQNHRYVKAVAHLRIVGHQTRIAHTAATALIGRPPTDPESDEPPGIAAVQRVAGLEHQIAVKLTPTFQNVTDATVVHSLGRKLNVAVSCRDVMLAKVIALRPGARDDYADGLADTLPGYDKELTAISTALAGTGLTTAASASLQTAQQVVTATRTDMQRVFGGGERSPGRLR